MTTLALTLAGLLLLASPVAAQWAPRYQAPPPSSGSTYDVRSGNQYRWNRSGDGSTTVYGNNYNTGSQWNTSIRPNGDMRGTDSRGHFWNYNSSSGTYMNSNGTICTGRGTARFCN